MKVISPPGEEGVGVRARLNLLEERLRGEAGQDRFEVWMFLDVFQRFGYLWRRGWAGEVFVCMFLGGF